MIMIINYVEVMAWWLESRTWNRKVVSSSLGPAGIVSEGGVIVQLSLHLQYHDWGALEQDTEPPNAAHYVCVCVCVCVFTAVFVHFDGLKAEHKFPSMGHRMATRHFHLIFNKINQEE